MSRERVLRMGRARAEQGMTASVRIDRPVGSPVFDNATGKATPSDKLVVYAGKAKVASVHSFRQGDVAEGEQAQNNVVVLIPWSAPTPVDVHDYITIVDGPNTWTHGTVYQVESVQDKDDATCRRIYAVAQHR